MDHSAIDAELEAFTEAVSPTFHALARYRDLVQATPDSATVARARKRFMDHTRDEIADAVAQTAPPESADTTSRQENDSLRKLLRTASRIAINDLRGDAAHTSRQLTRAVGDRAKRMLRSARRILDAAPIAKFIKSGESITIGTSGHNMVLAGALGALCLTYAGNIEPTRADGPEAVASVNIEANHGAYPYPFEMRAPTIGFYDGEPTQAPTDRFYTIARKALTPEMGAEAADKHVSTARNLATVCMQRDDSCSVHTKGLSIDPLRGIHAISMLASDGTERIVLTEERGVARIHDYGLYMQLSQPSVEVQEITPSPIDPGSI